MCSSENRANCFWSTDGNQFYECRPAVYCSVSRFHPTSTSPISFNFNDDQNNNNNNNNNKTINETGFEHFFNFFSFVFFVVSVWLLHLARCSQTESNSHRTTLARNAHSVSYMQSVPRAIIKLIYRSTFYTYIEMWFFVLFVSIKIYISGEAKKIMLNDRDVSNIRSLKSTIYIDRLAFNRWSSSPWPVVISICFEFFICFFNLNLFGGALLIDDCKCYTKKKSRKEWVCTSEVRARKSKSQATKKNERKRRRRMCVCVCDAVKF